jgi:hypothetical protein
MTLESLNALVKPGALNFISPCGLGDTMRLSAYRNDMEQKHGLPIHFIIKPSHKIIMEMYDNANYSIYDFKDDELYDVQKHTASARKGEAFIAHPLYSDRPLYDRWIKSASHVDILFACFLNIKKESAAVPPKKYPRLGEASLRMDRAALLLPEARSVKPLKTGHWRHLAAALKQQGYTVRQSYSRKEFKIDGVQPLPRDLETIVAFALACDKVYSLRSGLCDLIAHKAKDITVFYPDSFSHTVFLIKGSNIKNILVRDVYAEIKSGVRNFLKETKNAS